MNNKSRIKAAITAAAIIGTSAQAASIAVNFKGGAYGDPLGVDVSGTAFGIDAADWTNVNTPDAPSNESFSVSGVNISYSANNEWSQARNQNNVNPGSDQVYFGYLDDGGGNQNISITGLSAWLTANAATDYTITLIMGADGTAVVDNTPLLVSDGGSSLGSFSMTQVTSSNGGAAGNGSITGLTSDTLFIDGQGSAGSVRGSIAGFTIVSNPVPEPSSTALVGLAGIGFILRRKR